MSEAWTAQGSVHVAAPIDQTYAIVADLESHAGFADRAMDVRRPAGGPGAEAGEIVLRGPLGLRMRIRTVVTTTERPHLYLGLAHVAGTTYTVAWHLQSVPGGTRVDLVATPVTVDRWHGILLDAGGGAWLSKRFDTTLSGLARVAESRSAELASRS